MLRLGMLPEGYAGLVIYERLRRSPITNKPKAATSIDNQNDGLVRAQMRADLEDHYVRTCQNAVTTH